MYLKDPQVTFHLKFWGRLSNPWKEKSLLQYWGAQSETSRSTDQHFNHLITNQPPFLMTYRIQIASEILYK